MLELEQEQQVVYFGMEVEGLKPQSSLLVDPLVGSGYLLKTNWFVRSQMKFTIFLPHHTRLIFKRTISVPSSEFLVVNVKKETIKLKTFKMKT